MTPELFRNSWDVCARACVHWMIGTTSSFSRRRRCMSCLSVFCGSVFTLTACMHVASPAVSSEKLFIFALSCRLLYKDSKREEKINLVFPQIPRFLSKLLSLYPVSFFALPQVVLQICTIEKVYVRRL